MTLMKLNEIKNNQKKIHNVIVCEIIDVLEGEDKNEEINKDVHKIHWWIQYATKGRQER